MRPVLQEQGALPHVAQDQGRIDQGEPTDPDGPPAEMTEVGEHRLAAGQHQHDRAQDKQGPVHVAVKQEGEAIARGESLQDLRPRDDLADAEDGDREEPDDHDRTEDAADAVSSPALEGEQEREQHDGDGNDGEVELGRGDGDAFHGRKHADGRRDHAVAKEEAGAEQQEPQHGRQATLAWLVEQAEQGEHAAFAVILGLQDEDGVLDGNDDRQRPDDQRDSAVDFVRRELGAAVAGKHQVQRIEGRGADVAVDDPQRSHHQTDLSLARPSSARFVRAYRAGPGAGSAHVRKMIPWWRWN